MKKFWWRFPCLSMKPHWRHAPLWEDSALLFLERSAEKTGKMQSLGEARALAGSRQPLRVLSAFFGGGAGRGRDSERRLR